jgi:hypothetical protein
MKSVWTELIIRTVMWFVIAWGIPTWAYGWGESHMIMGVAVLSYLMAIRDLLKGGPG